VIGIIFAIGCRSPSLGSALACEAKANLHPLAFYTIKVTSPFRRTIRKGVAGPMASSKRKKRGYRGPQKAQIFLDFDPQSCNPISLSIRSFTYK
jgi:hypothetical protein